MTKLKAKVAPDTEATNATHEATTNRQEHFTLSSRHLQALKESAISDDVIAERGYRTITGPAELEALGFAPQQCRVPGLLLPLFAIDGDKAFCVYRPDSSRSYDDKKGKRNSDGTWPQKVIKYETPKGTTIRLDCPPRCLPKLADVSIPLWVTEGQKKADSLASRGLCAIALLGVWNWITKWRNEFGQTEWGLIVLKSRTVNIVFDSDVMNKAEVRKALERLTKYLQRKGATVNAVYLPHDPKRGKVGVDDWLAGGHTCDELLNLIDTPRPAPQLPPPFVELLDDSPLTIRRPLVLINGRAYAAIWPYTRVTHNHTVDKQGNIETLPQPKVVEDRQLVIVRDDGERFGDGMQHSFAELGYKVHLQELPPQTEKLWSTPGAKAYINNHRPNPADVFHRVADVIDRFVDFEQSLADQKTMCEMLTCFILSTWFLDAANVSGALWLTGEKGSGKSHSMSLLCELAHLGQALIGSSSSASVRDLASYGATLGLDEAESIADKNKIDPALRDLFLASNRRGMPVSLREVGADNKYHTVLIDAFGPKMFTAISNPFDTLSSRVIIVPLAKSPDRNRNNSDPLDFRQWPHDRRALIDDLWALALSRLPEFSNYDSIVAEHARLTGRDLQPWRGILTVAAWLDRNGKPGLWAQMEVLASEKYQAERGDLEVADLTKVIVKALVALCRQEDPSKREWQFSTAELVEQVQKVIKDEEIDLDPDKVNPRGLGRRLGKMRLVHEVNIKPKGWRTSRRLLTRLCGAYKLPLPDGVENSQSETSDLLTNVEGVEDVEGVEALFSSTSSTSSTPSTFPDGIALPELQKSPCGWCGHVAWWINQAGGLVCGNCHPNPNVQNVP